MWQKTCPVCLTRPAGDFKFNPSCPLKLVEILTANVHKLDIIAVTTLSQICLKKIHFPGLQSGPLTKMFQSDGTSRSNYHILMTCTYSRCTRCLLGVHV